MIAKNGAQYKIASSCERPGSNKCIRYLLAIMWNIHIMMMDFDAEKGLVIWRCGDHFVSRETYCWTYDAGLANLVFPQQSSCSSFRKWICGSFSACLPSRTALQYNPAIKNVTSHADSGQISYVTAPWLWLETHTIWQQVARGPRD